MSLMEIKKKATRASPEQLNKMLSFFYENVGLAEGKFLAQHGKARLLEKWEELTEILNAMSGGVKTLQQWQTASLLHPR